MANDDAFNVQAIHKEETEVRISSDLKDKEGIQYKLELNIKIFDPVSHPEGIMNLDVQIC